MWAKRQKEQTKVYGSQFVGCQMGLRCFPFCSTDTQGQDLDPYHQTVFFYNLMKICGSVTAFIVDEFQKDYRCEKSENDTLPKL